MRFSRLLRRTFGSRTFRGEVLGALVEARLSSNGGESVIVDGDRISHHPWAYYTGNHEHFFSLTPVGENEKRNIEVRVEDRSGGLQASMRVVVNVDGEPLTTLAEIEPDEYTRCPHCAYDLKGLAPENDEVRCPECGRHTSVKLLG